MKYLRYFFPVFKYFSFVFLLVSVGQTALAQTPDTTLTLQQCLDIAIKNNLLVKQSEIAMESSRISYNQARENMLPSINGSASQGVSNGRSINPFTNGYVTQQITTANYNLNTNLILSRGLTLQNNIRATSLAYQAGQMDFQQAKDNLTLNIITAYLQVLDSEDQLTQANTQLAVTQKQESRAETLNKDGAIPPSQLYDLKGQLAGDQLSLVNARTTLAVNKLNLLQLMNVPYKKNIKLQRQLADQLPTEYTATADEIYNKALSDLAYVKASTLRRESAEKSLQVAKGSLLPTLSLSGGLGTNYSSAATRSIFADSSVVRTGEFVNTPAGARQSVYTVAQNYNSQNIGYADQFKNNYGTSVSLGLSIPILNYFQNKNRITQAKLDFRGAQYVEQNTRIQLRQNIDQAYVNMTGAYERYKLLVMQVEALTESNRIAEIQFNAGVLNSVDFLVVKNKVDEAKISLISGRYDYLIRTKILDYYQSRLSL